MRDLTIIFWFQSPFSTSRRFKVEGEVREEEKEREYGEMEGKSKCSSLRPVVTRWLALFLI